MELCDLDIHRSADTVVFRLTGEVDASNAPDLERRLQREELAACVVMDLSGVSYLDSSGLRMIHLLQRDVRDAAGNFCVVAPDGSAPRRLLDITGLSDDVSVVTATPGAA